MATLPGAGSRPTRGPTFTCASSSNTATFVANSPSTHTAPHVHPRRRTQAILTVAMNLGFRKCWFPGSLAISLSLITAAFAESQIGTTDAAAIDRFVQQSLRATGVPGAALAVVKDGTVLHVAGYGHDSSGQPVTAGSRMRIASLSKSFTALAIMQLVEQGRLSLDAPLQSVIPRFHIADERGGTITVRHLLNQVSGLADTTFPEMSLPQPDSLEAATTRLSTATSGRRARNRLELSQPELSPCGQCGGGGER